MSQSLVIGPFALPLAMLLLFAAAGSALLVGDRLARKAGLVVEPVLWRTLLVGLVVARLAFVWEFRSAYFAAPLGVLDIRDGGWNATAGFVGSWLFALSQQGRRPALRKPLQMALLVGSLVWLMGSIALALRPGTGQELPDLAFTSLDGRTVPLAEFKGRPVVLNLWATWCPPCVREMPVLDRAQKDHPGVHFVFVNQGEPAARVASWLHARQFQMRHMLLDPTGQAGAAFQQSALPTTLFFDAQGRLVSLRVGELSAATLAERLQAIGP